MKAILTTTALVLFLVCHLATAGPETTKTFNGYKLEAKDSAEAFHPVVGISEGFPLILTEAGIVQSGKRYVKVKPASQINDLFVEIYSIEEKRTEKAIILTVKLKSSNPLENPYALIVYTDAEKGQLRCKYDSIPGLSGEAEKIKLRFNSNKVPETGWRLHFFNGQRQLYTNKTEDIKDATPKQAFILQLGRHVAQVGDGDAGPTPFYMPLTKPDPEDLPPGEAPLTVRVKLTIEKTGNVGNFTFEDKVNPDLNSLLSANIRDWLFFPRMSGGEMVDTTVILPIQLR
jgi:hypothetical protein